jgi:hypothetical protein
MKHFARYYLKRGTGKILSLEELNTGRLRKCWLWSQTVDTVRLTSIDHPKIGGAYISRLRARNFNFLVGVDSSSE